MSSTRLKSTPSGIAASPPRSPTRSSGVWWLWIVTCLAFPAAGYIGRAVAGPVDGLPSAVFAGVVTGIVLGVLQWALLRRRGASAALDPGDGCGLRRRPRRRRRPRVLSHRPTRPRRHGGGVGPCGRRPAGEGHRGHREAVARVGWRNRRVVGRRVDAHLRRDRCHRPVAHLRHLRCTCCRLRAEPVHQASPADRRHAGARRPIAMNVSLERVRMAQLSVERPPRQLPVRHLSLRPPRRRCRVHRRVPLLPPDHRPVSEGQGRRLGCSTEHIDVHPPKEGSPCRRQSQSPPGNPTAALQP